MLEKYLTENTVSINNKYYNYIKNVLRMNVYDKVTLLDGKGNIYSAILEKIEKNQIIARIINRIYKEENTNYICCAYSIPKGERHEFLIEKLTEIGIKEMIPVKFEHSINYTFNYNSNKYNRMKKIIVSALCQAGNPIEPILYEQTNISHIIQISAKFKYRFYGKYTSSISIKNIADYLTEPAKILYVVGPEGGLTPSEEKILNDNKFIPICVSPHILKIETAAVVIGGLLQVITTMRNTKIHTSS